MALRWIDSFDNMGTSGGTILLTKYDASRSSLASAVTVSTTVARTGACSLRMASPANLETNALGVSGTTFVVGAALYVDSNAFGSGANGNGYLIEIMEEDETIHLRLAINTAGTIKVYRNTTLLGTSTATITFNTWYQLEFKGVIADSPSGSYEVHLDGVNILSDSGIDTRNAGTGTWNRVNLKNGYLLAFTYWDDYWILDGSGVRNNDFLGLQKVGSSRAVADSVAAGSNANFTPSTGTDHGALVDENPANGDTDYNSSSTVGHIDTYRIQAVSLTGTTRGIQVNRYVKKTDAGAKTSRAVIRSGGTNFAQATQSPSTTYGYLSVVSETDPATSALWTKTALDAAEFGEEIVT